MNCILPIEGEAVSSGIDGCCTVGSELTEGATVTPTYLSFNQVKQC
jgi:hypothetical protein